MAARRLGIIELRLGGADPAHRVAGVSAVGFQPTSASATGFSRWVVVDTATFFQPGFSRLVGN